MRRSAGSLPRGKYVAASGNSPPRAGYTPKLVAIHGTSIRFCNRERTSIPASGRGEWAKKSWIRWSRIRGRQGTRYGYPRKFRADCVDVGVPSALAGLALSTPLYKHKMDPLPPGGIRALGPSRPTPPPFVNPRPLIAHPPNAGPIGTFRVDH